MCFASSSSKGLCNVVLTSWAGMILLPLHSVRFNINQNDFLISPSVGYGAPFPTSQVWKPGASNRYVRPSVSHSQIYLFPSCGRRVNAIFDVSLRWRLSLEWGGRSCSNEYIFFFSFWSTQPCYFLRAFAQPNVLQMHVFQTVQYWRSADQLLQELQELTHIMIMIKRIQLNK